MHKLYYQKMGISKIPPHRQNSAISKNERFMTCRVYSEFPRQFYVL